MALINCPECGKRVSSYAVNCPHCGYVITQYSDEPYDEISADAAYSAKPTRTTRSICANDQASENKITNQRASTPNSRKNSESRDVKVGCLFFLVLIIIPLILVFLSSYKSNSSSSYSSSSYGSGSYDSLDKKTVAQLHAEAFVKKYLKSPSTAKFPNYTEYSYDYNGNKWTVSGYVDAQNAYGATLRQEFTVSFTVSSSDLYNATLDSIDID